MSNIFHNLSTCSHLHAVHQAVLYF